MLITKDNEEYIYNRNEKEVYNDEGKVIGYFTKGIPENYDIGVITSDELKNNSQITPSNF